MITACAYIWAYNEEDFLPWTIKHLLSQGIDIIVFDNWSTDRTWEILKSFLPQIAIDKFPVGGQQCVSLTSRLKYLEELAFHSKYDWIINHDVDEIRKTKSGIRMIEFISRVDRAGFNAIDHQLQVYMPKEGWTGEQNPEEFFDQRLKLSHVDETNPHIKCWKRTKTKVDLVSSGGHEAKFAGRRVAPLKMLLKHYPLRTQAHAERKLAERRQSYAEHELASGWHIQYNNKWW